MESDGVGGFWLFMDGQAVVSSGKNEDQSVYTVMTGERKNDALNLDFAMEHQASQVSLDAQLVVGWPED